MTNSFGYVTLKQMLRLGLKKIVRRRGKDADKTVEMQVKKVLSGTEQGIILMVRG